jgi:hypothetical protein
LAKRGTTLCSIGRRGACFCSTLLVRPMVLFFLHLTILPTPERFLRSRLFVDAFVITTTRILQLC